MPSLNESLIADLFLGQCTPTTEFTSLWEVPATDIDGNLIAKLGDLAGSKATLVVNVATY